MCEILYLFLVYSLASKTIKMLAGAIVTNIHPRRTINDSTSQSRSQNPTRLPIRHPKTSTNCAVSQYAVAKQFLEVLVFDHVVLPYDRIFQKEPFIL